MTLAKIIEESKKDFQERETLVLEPIRCIWKEVAEDENSTTFKSARNNPFDPNYACTTCQEYEWGCEKYRSFMEELLY